MREFWLVSTMWVVTVCTFISYFPQLLKMFRTKKVEDLSYGSWILWSVGAIANLVYSILLGRLELIVSSACEAFLILATLVMMLYYTYMNDYYLESEEKFNEKLNRLSSDSLSLVEDRERRKLNRAKSKFFK